MLWGVGEGGRGEGEETGLEGLVDFFGGVSLCFWEGGEGGGGGV